MDDEERRKYLDPAWRTQFARQRFAEDLLQCRCAPFTAGIMIKRGSCPCDYAEVLNGAYRTEDAPDFPPACCSHVDGACTCWWENIFNSDPVPAEWKKAETLHPLAGGPLPRNDPAPTRASIHAAGHILGLSDDEVLQAVRNAGLDTQPAILEQREKRGILARIAGLFGFK